MAIWRNNNSNHIFLIDESDEFKDFNKLLFLIK